MATRLSMDSVAQIYVPDDEYIWRPAELISESSGEIEVRIFDGSLNPTTKRISYGKSFTTMESYPLRTDQFPVNGFDDMSSLNYLHEASILENLELRFKSRHPYTYAGDICIAVNPYQWLDLYSEETRFNINFMLVKILFKNNY